MDITTAIRTNLEDIANFGPGFLLRHLARLRADKIVAINVPGFGRISLRCGESDIQVVRQVFAQREYDPLHPALRARLAGKYEAILDSGHKPVIVDAGANIGAASLWFGKIYPEARIVAIEPDPSSAALLRRNVADLPNVTVLEAAIGSRHGFARLVSNGPSWGIQMERSPAGVEIVTMQDALAASGGDVPFLVKVDIEGFENDLFASSTEWLDETFAVVIEPHDWLKPGKHSSRSFQRAFAARSFEIFVRGENLFYVREPHS